MTEQIDMIVLETEDKMDKAVSSLSKQFTGIRTGRANPNLLDRVLLDYYGVPTPLKQVASISVPEAQQLYIKPFDKSVLKDIEHAINVSGLDLPPRNDGIGIRLILPSLTEDRRRELVKEVDKLAEGGRVAIRIIRRESNDQLKKIGLPEDAEHGYLEDIQKMTDDYIKKIDDLTKEKGEELLKI